MPLECEVVVVIEVGGGEQVYLPEVLLEVALDSRVPDLGRGNLLGVKNSPFAFVVVLEFSQVKVGRYPAC